MNTRTIVVLMLILALLGAGLWFRKASLRSRNLNTTISLHSLASQDLMNATALELTGPDKTVVRLDKTTTGWVVDTLDQAPANDAAITHFLQTLNTLRGEPRAEDAAILGDFNLEDNQATRLEIYEDQAKLLDLYLGKGDFRAAFVRKQDSATIYVVPGTFLTQTGLRGQIPASQFWINTNLLSVAPADIHELELTTPASKALLSRQEPSAKEDGTSASNTDQALQWGFEQSKGDNLTRERMEEILSALTRVTVAEAVLANDPRLTSLERASHTLTIRTKNTTMTLHAARPDLQNDALARLDDAPHAYTMRGVVFERLFPEPEPVTNE